jgi:two-component system, sensor histidine kinase
VAQTLRRDPQLSDVLLIALTGYGAQEDQRRAIEAGFDQHMTKPVSFQDMSRALASLTAESLTDRCYVAGDREAV